MTLEMSLTLLENIYSTCTGVTHYDRNMIVVQATGVIFYLKKLFLSIILYKGAIKLSDLTLT